MSSQFSFRKIVKNVIRRKNLFLGKIIINKGNRKKNLDGSAIKIKELFWAFLLFIEPTAIKRMRGGG